MFTSLRDFLTALDAAGELKRVAAPVSPILEIAEIADRESKSAAPNEPSRSAQLNDPRLSNRGGQALLFENVEGSDVPVLINAFGSYRRLEIALGCQEAGRGITAGHTPGGFDALGRRIGRLAKPEPPRSLAETLAKLRQFAPLLRIGPRTVRSGPCQQVVVTGENIDLTQLPFIKCWPLDGDLASVGYPADINDHVEGADLIHDPNFAGRYTTFAGIHTIHADDAGAKKPASHNIGMYRVQLVGRRRLAMHWHMHHDGARHWRSWKQAGKPMPIAIAFGGESVLPFASIAPLPPGISELLLAGFLNKRGIPLVPCKTVPLRVPANAEIIIEGFVNPAAGPPGFDPRHSSEPLGPGAFFEGPFGDHTGFYSLPDRYPLVEVTAITMREKPIFPATIVGMPPQEDYYLGKAVERIFLPLLQTIVHDIEDYDLPTFGAFHNAAVIQIRKEYPLQGRRVMHSVWGAGQMAWTKCVFVVDTDVDMHDARAVLAAVGANCRPGRDIEFVNGPLDILDHAAPRLGAGSKIGFDATRKIAGEEVGGVALDTDDSLQPIDDAAIDRLRAEIDQVVEVGIPPELGGVWMLVRMKATNDTDLCAQRNGILDVVRAATGDSAHGIVILLSENVDIARTDEALFHWVANWDPGRDTSRAGDIILFDARAKIPGTIINGEPVRDWPPIIEMDARTKKRVDSRAAELGLI